MIMEGLVYVDRMISDKAGRLVDDRASLEIKETTLPFVGRGGLKLQKAIECFHLDLRQAVCMDVGASTGGFTDCMLQHGASLVYAVDVGYGQLAWKLRTDPRVVVMERCNFRYFDKNVLERPVDFLSVDVSFISLRHIFPVAGDLLPAGASLVALIKPQFEAGREEVGKKGIVRDPAVQQKVIRACLTYAEEAGFSPCALTFSPIKGAQGNIEYLLYLNKGKKIGYNIDDACIHDVVEASRKEAE